MTNFYKNKQQIINWLEKHEVKNYILVPDEKYGFVVDVNGNVNLFGKYLINIPIKFNNVSISFNCGYNQLTSLEFSPQKVGGSFICQSNQLDSLEFCPQAISGVFSCSYNKLTSLEFCPETIGGKFYCNDNQLLKEIQQINDFNLILLEHKKILITKLSDKLENDLSNDNSKKTAKIKI